MQHQQTYRAGGGAGRQRPLTGPQRPANLLDLPLEMLDEIFSYVGYHKVSQIRVVSGNCFVDFRLDLVDFDRIWPKMFYKNIRFPPYSPST